MDGTDGLKEVPHLMEVGIALYLLGFLTPFLYLLGGALSNSLDFTKTRFLSVRYWVILTCQTSLSLFGRCDHG